MEFWWVFFGISVFMIPFVYLLPAKYKDIGVYTYLLFVILVSGFRDNIGTDFGAYQDFFTMYGSHEFFYAMEANAQLEPAIAFLIPLLERLGGAYQSFFMLYAIITFVGFYYGAKNFFRGNYLGILLVLLLYITYNSTGGFWWGMNGVRQAAAMSIVFGFSSCLYMGEQKKFILAVCVASLFHYSSLVFLPAYFFCQISFRKKWVLFAVIFSSVLTLSGLSKDIVLGILSFGLGILGRYEGALLLITEGGKSFSYMSFIYMAMYLFAFYTVKDITGRREQIFFNMATIFIIMRILTSFSLGGESIQYILHRFEVYYLPFFFVFFTEALTLTARRFKPELCGWILVSFFIAAMSFLNVINIARVGGIRDYPLEPSDMVINVEYQPNFKLFE